MRTYTGQLTDLPNKGIAIIGANDAAINGNPSKGTGGAMLLALNKGWVKQGENVSNRFSDCGRMFGLSTVTYPGKKRSKTPAEIIKGIEILYYLASIYPEFDFYVFYCAGKRNLNGYSDKEMAQMFSALPPPDNIIFEDEFAKLLTV